MTAEWQVQSCCLSWPTGWPWVARPRARCTLASPSATHMGTGCVQALSVLRVPAQDTSQGCQPAPAGNHALRCNLCDVRLMLTLLHDLLKAATCFIREAALTCLPQVRQLPFDSALYPGCPAHHDSCHLVEQVLESFQVLLHEFRSLQQELGPWTAAFQEQHARKPRLADVERTGLCLPKLYLKGCLFGLVPLSAPAVS